MRIEDDLFRSHSRILGRVVTGCEVGETPRPGMAGVRLLMEDGRYAITDEHGMYHFEGLRPGTHVVQLDPVSLPANLELAECEQNTRVAGSQHSRFVDVQGGTLWRVDFQLREKAPREGSLELRMRSALHGNAQHYRINLSGDTISYLNRRLTVMLPEGLDYVA